MSEENDEVGLPADTQEILRAFLEERAQRERAELESIQNKTGTDAEFAENWQLSQFWYAESTKQILCYAFQKLLNKHDVENYSIALLSCPSLYSTVKSLHNDVKIFEYDQRFEAFGDDFVYYDFNEADTADYLKDYYGKFDFIIADPPFLSEECIQKTSTIVKNLQKPEAEILLCTGEVVEELVQKFLSLKKCKFRPIHERNLGNEFVAYANFDLDDLIEN